MRGANRVVADGYERARSACEPELRAQVTAEYAERLANASFWKQWWLRWEMRREVVRRVHEKAPPYALY